MNTSDTSVREFVQSFTKTCAARGITDPLKIAALMKTAVSRPRVEDTTSLIEGFTKQCEAVGIKEPALIAGLFKAAVQQVMQQKPYAANHDGTKGAKSVFKKYESAAKMYAPGGKKSAACKGNSKPHIKTYPAMKKK